MSNPFDQFDVAGTGINVAGVSSTLPPPIMPGKPPSNTGGGNPFDRFDPPSGGGPDEGDKRSIAERFAKGAWEGIGQAGVGMMQAATELVAPTGGVNALTGDLGGVKKTLTNTVDSSRHRAEDLGTAGKVGEVAGMVAGFAPLALATAGGGAPAAGSLVMRAIPEAIAQGGLQGAVASVGSNDSRMGNVVTGAEFGGATGAAGQALRPVVAGAKALGSAAQTVGSAAKTAYNGRTAQELWQDIVQKTGKTPEELKSLLEAGKISTIADIGGDSVQGLTRAVAKTGVGKDIISDALEGRSMDAVKRVSDELSKNVSHVDTYFGNLDDVATARQKVAAPLYQEAYKANPSVQSKTVDRILDTPAGRSALKSAVSKMQNDRSLVGIPDAELGEQARLAGIKSEGGVAPGLNLRTLDYVKRSLDDQIGEAQRAGQRDNARILTGLKGDLVKSLDEADVTAKAGPNSLKPEGGAYKQARQVFSDHSRLIEAQEAGRDFASQTPEQLRMALKDMAPDQKEAFRIGVREGLQNTVNKTADGADPAKRIFGNTQKRAQLQEVFDNPENFKAFEARMNEEIRAAGTKQRVLGGSRTDYNIAADDELGQMAADLPRKGATRTALDAAMNKAVDFVTKRYYGVNDENAKIIANALVNREAGIKALNDLIKNSSGATQEAATAAKGVITKAMQAPNPAENPVGNLITRTPMRNAPNPTDKPLRIDIGRKTGSK